MAANQRSAAHVKAATEAIREARFWREYQERRYAILFYTLLFALVVMPIAVALHLNVTTFEILLGAILIAAVMPLGTVKTRRFVLTGLALLMLARLVSIEIHQRALSDSTLGIWAVVGLFAAAGALRFVVKSEEISSEHIYAALSAYLLAGVFFGVIYWVVELALPGSFSGPDPMTSERAVYFSFVTLATLGYGDFLPKTDMARGMVVFEVVGGQLFLAVMIARLVGLYGGGKKSG
jgi:hypothetical protein